MKLLVLLLLTLVSSPAGDFRDDSLTSRELTGIAEDQALLSRQLGRLRQTMQVLALRLEAEGRPRAVELLKQGLELLNDRDESAQSLTLEESMDDARERMQNGQVVQSLERQAMVIEGMQRLLAILMERGNLDNIEENLERNRELQRALEELGQRESKLQQDTRDLREDSSTSAQRQLEQDIEQAIVRQREILEATERDGRESGSLELEQIEQALRKLRSDLEHDAAVMEAWKPAEQDQLDAARGALDGAQRAEDRARRLDDAADLLSQSAAVAGSNPSPEEMQKAEAALAEERERAMRHARASGDESTQAVAEALDSALEALRAAQVGEDEKSAAATATAEAAELREAATGQRGQAGDQRSEATDQLEEIADSDTIGGLLAREVLEGLERAGEAASEDRGRSRSESAEQTNRAANHLRRGLEDLERMAEALSSSQESLSEDGLRLERGIATLEIGDTPAGREARQHLNRAAESMREAASEARQERPQPAREAMDAADRALADAEELLAEARETSTSANTEARAEEQRALSAAVEKMRSQTSTGSMSPGSEAQLSEALQEAQQAMETAAKELESNRGSKASQAQREALRSLSRAGKSAEEGVQPNTQEGRERAEQLAREQEAIREEILQLSTREDERRNPEATRDLQEAGESASEAEQQLESGQLQEAEESEEEVKRDLKRAQKELEKEEEQYERLRQEELLFRITEEVRSALEGHTQQMLATREIAAQVINRDRPSRSQKIRLRRIAREEEAIGTRIGELAEALREEQSLVFTEVLLQAHTDLSDIAIDLGELGDWDTGERTQARQRDVQESLEWLLEALQQEQQRREEEDDQQEQEGEEPQETENRLVPDSAELKLLRRMEVEIQESVERLLILYPELGEELPEDINPLILDDIMRLAVKHERTSQLFSLFRSRLGLPEPEPAGESEDL